MNIYYACKYTPVELIEACGQTPMPLTFETASFKTSDVKTSPNICGYAKTLIEFALSGKVQALVLTTCCDAMRRTYDVLKHEVEKAEVKKTEVEKTGDEKNKAKRDAVAKNGVEKDEIEKHETEKGDGSLEFVYLLDLPHDETEESARRYAHDLEKFQDALQSYLQAKTDKLDAKKLLLAWEKAAEASPQEKMPHTGSFQQSPILLIGAHATPSLLKLGADVFGNAFENLTCSGQRSLPAPPRDLLRDPSKKHCEHACEFFGDCSENRDPLLQAYAKALLNQTPCYRMVDVEEREAFLRTRISDTHALGCIFHTMKFCDFYGFEHAQQVKHLETPLIKIETEGTPQSTGQIKTRLEAYAESIGHTPEFPAKEECMDSSATNASNHLEELATHTSFYAMGIDSGSTSTDAVIVDNTGAIVASTIVPTGANALKSAQAAYEDVLNKANLAAADISYCVGTGYGRDALPHTNCTITEITCHAKGAHALVPQTRTIIDIGGQDSKAIQIDKEGHVETFAMNDKCAAGTGRFIEALARTMELELDEFATAALSWKAGVSQDVVISSMCTVFAESEVISLVADNVDIVDIIHGLNKSVAQKTASLTKRVNATGPYLMTGGVAQNIGVVRALEEVLGEPVVTSPEAQIAGAYGAALLALERRGR